MKPGLLKFEGDYRDRLAVVKVDVRNSSTAEFKEYRPLMDSKYVPYTILIDKDKKVLQKHTGALSAEEIATMVKPYCKK
jgi:hypothetical protein